MAASPTKVVTGKVRLSYAKLFEATAFQPGQTAKYSTVILVPKSDTDTLTKLRNAQKAALEEGKSTKFNGKIPANWKNTLRDGDDETECDLESNPEYAGHWFMTVSNTRRPGIVDRDMNPIIDPTEVYSGCWARVSLNAYAFSAQGNKGISFGLNNVMKWANGEPLGSTTTAESDFKELSDLDEDEDSGAGLI